MTGLLVFACIIMAIILAVVLVAKQRGTNIEGLFKVDSSKYFKIVDDIK